MQSLQTVFGLGDRFISEDMINDITTESLKVDYSQMEEKIEKKRDESITYLKDAIYGKEN
jgi:hypothetical protein